jgi:hypothetical protein
MKDTMVVIHFGNSTDGEFLKRRKLRCSEAFVIRSSNRRRRKKRALLIADTITWFRSGKLRASAINCAKGGEAMQSCKYCGGRIIFRFCRQLPDGRMETRKRPFPIHVDGPCTRCP